MRAGGNLFQVTIKIVESARGHSVYGVNSIAHCYTKTITVSDYGHPIWKHNSVSVSQWMYHKGDDLCSPPLSFRLQTGDSRKHLWDNFENQLNQVSMIWFFPSGVHMANNSQLGTFSLIAILRMQLYVGLYFYIYVSIFVCTWIYLYAHTLFLDISILHVRTSDVFTQLDAFEVVWKSKSVVAYSTLLNCFCE